MARSISLVRGQGGRVRVAALRNARLAALQAAAPAAAVLATSRGPVLYRPARIVLNGRRLSEPRLDRDG